MYTLSFVQKLMPCHSSPALNHTFINTIMLSRFKLLLKAFLKFDKKRTPLSDKQEKMDG